MDSEISYIIVSLLPKEISERCISVRNTLLKDNEKHTVPTNHVVLLDIPHMTLKSSFFLHNSSETELQNKLEAIRFSSISMSLTSSTLYRTKRYGNVVAILPKPNTELMNLHKQIFKIIKPISRNRNENFYENETYTPHVSVAYDVSENNINTVTNNTESNVIPFDYTLTAFQVMRTVRERKHERISIRI